MARLSLCLGLMAMMAAGCLVGDPPEYGQPKKTPPFLDLTETHPKVFERVDIQPGNVKTFNVPFRSEDAGEGLIAQFILDYKIIINGKKQEAPQGIRPQTPSTFDDDSRSVSFDFNAPPTPGCHQLTMILTHSSNLELVDTWDVAYATWWVNVGDSDTSNLVNCPPNGGGA